MPPKSKRRDDDDDYDRPIAKRPPLRKNASAAPWLLIGLLGGGAVLFLGCGVVGGIAFWWLNREPQVIKVGKDFVKDGFPLDKDGPVKKDVPVKIKPANLVVEPTTRIQTDATAEVKDIIFAAQRQGVGFYFWETEGAFKRYFEFWDWKTSQRLTRIELADEGRYMNLSPNGTRFLLQRGNGQALSIWTMPAGQAMPDWDPYQGQPNDPIKTGNMVWANFLDEDRLLTVCNRGRFDLWTINTKQSMYSIPAAKQNVFLTVNGFNRCPQNFCLSPDRKILALPNGEGFDFFAASTGVKTGNTQSFAPQGRVGNIWSASFSRDGALFASKGNLHLVGGKTQEFITVWDVPSGKQRWQFPVALDFDITGPINWIGPRHLMIMDGNIYKGHIFSLDKGRYERVCRITSNGDRFARNCPDDRIWYGSRPPFNAPLEIMAVDFPVNELTQHPAPPVVNARDLPSWSFSVSGIQR